MKNRTIYFLIFIFLAVTFLSLFVFEKDGGVRTERTGVYFVFDKQEELDRLIEKLSTEGLMGEERRRYEELMKEQMIQLEEQGRALYEKEHKLGQSKN